jgi:hypothetical protein
MYEEDEELEGIIAPFLEADLARDVANVYLDQSVGGLHPGVATAGVFEAFRELLDDPNEGPVIFLALASMQLRRGKVLAPVRDVCLELIESGDAQRAWRRIDPKLNEAKRKALDALATRLRGVELA